MKTMEDDPPGIVKQMPNPPSLALDVNADCQSIVVNAPAAEVYRICLRFEELPRFVTSITSIEKINDTRFSCISIIDEKEIKTDVMIMMRIPDRRIAWQAVSNQFRAGAVCLDPLPGHTTKVTVKIRSIIEPMLLTAALRSYLANFKRFVEQKQPAT